MSLPLTNSCPAATSAHVLNEAVETSETAVPHAEAWTFADAPRLTAALKRGDEKAFEWLHHAWALRINRYCFALAAGDETLAHEISQSVWLRIVRHLRVLPDEAALWSWIACSARHAASDLRRKSGRYLRALVRFATWWCSDASADTSAVDSLITALDAAMGKLSAIERDMVEARYFSREPLDVIANRHALTTRAVEGRLARIRDRLRMLIAEELQHSN